MKFYSHPGVFLKDHLKYTGKLARNFVEILNIREKEKLSQVAEIIGNCHDFGKYTSYFQEHLLKSINLGVRSHHAFLSGLFTAHQVKLYLEKSSFEKEIIDRFLPLISYVVVHRHHGDLRSPEEIIPRLNNESEVRIVLEQIKDLQENLDSIKKDINGLRILKIESFINSKVVKEILHYLHRKRYELIEKEVLSENQKIKLYFLTLLLYSALIDADKKITAKVSKIERKNIPSDIVDNYIKISFKISDGSSLDKMRQEVYKNVVNKVDYLNLNEKIFTLTAPTGSGKTLTALSFALKLRERIRREKNYIPRIIYCLPFVNIIEQNYDVFSKVLSLISDFKRNLSSYLLKHHHLADLEYKHGNELKPLDESLLLIEAWESEIIVTTFVQLMHTIVGFKNSFLKKFHNLVGSIIILDEVQSIPVEYWKLTRNVLDYLTKILGCYVVQMTATQPIIFSKSEKVELLEKNEKYFNSLGRVVLKSKINKEFTDEEFIEWFRKIFSKEKSYLIVVNTIGKSINLYTLFKNNLKEEVIGFSEYLINDRRISCLQPIDELAEYFFRKKLRPLIHLSANIIPCQRLYRINFLKKFLERGGKAIVISTQVVEAGVDLDFDVVIRDIGPLDSIIQVAGRCNRNNGKKVGEFFVFKLCSGYAQYVYGAVHPMISECLLRNKKILKEKEFYSLIHAYFKEVSQRIPDCKSKKIWEAMLNLCFHHNQLPDVSDFKLIEEKGQFCEVFIEIDENAKIIEKEFRQNVLKERDFLKRKNTFLKLKKDFLNYLLSIRKEHLEKNTPPKMENSNIYFVPASQLQNFYDLETGYIYKKIIPMVF